LVFLMKPGPLEMGAIFIYPDLLVCFICTVCAIGVFFRVKGTRLDRLKGGLLAVLTSVPLALLVGQLFFTRSDGGG
jgi:hypothetical protein